MTSYPPIRVHIPNKTVSARDGLFYPINHMAFSDGVLYFGRHGAENPSIAYQERWLFPEQGWVVIRWTLHSDGKPLGYDWYIDIDRTDIHDGHWTITDRYLDMIVHERVGYEVLDADELADAVAAGRIEVAEALRSLRSLDGLARSLRKHDFSMLALLQELAPGLPAIGAP